MIRSSLNRAAHSMNKLMVRGFSYYLINEKIPIEVARKRFAQVNSLASTPAGVDVELSQIASIDCEIIRPQGYQGDRCLLYMHGGGFCLGTPKTHRELTAWLAKTLQAKVVVPDYRLAPEHPFPSGLEDCYTVYQALLTQGQDSKRMIVGGDSAGGNLAVSLLLRVKDAGLPMAAAAILYSPWVDLRCTSESFYTKRKLDPIMSGSWLRKMREHYRNGVDVNHHELSPVHADLSGFPPMLIHAGSNEVLLNDSMLLEQSARADHCEVHLKVWDELWHVFHANVQYLDIAKQALFETRDFINKVI